MFLKKQKGQVLLIVVLVIVVASTIGLSLASRSIISLRTSTEDVESQKALSAAEAGIERAIQGLVPKENSSTIPNLSYNTKVVNVDAAEIFLDGGNSIPTDEGADLWLSTYDTNPSSNYSDPQSGTLNIYWGESSADDCKISALEVIVVFAPKNNPTIKRYAYDPCGGRAAENKFTIPTKSSGGESITFAGTTKTFYYNATIAIPSPGGLIARIIPIYGNATANNVFGIKMDFAVPPLQGYQISSLGTAGEAKRNIRVFKAWPRTYLPYLSYGLFVAKNK
jgi:hypothetical protein